MTHALGDLILCNYLFNFVLAEGEENQSVIQETADKCLRRIYDASFDNDFESADREWNVEEDAPAFQKLRAAFASVMDRDTPPITPLEQGNLPEYYHRLKKEMLLKESRLILWKALAVDDFDMEPLRACTGAVVAQQFCLWLDENPDHLEVTVLDLRGKELVYLPPEIERFMHLQVLNLKSNFLEEIPPEVGRLACLEELFLHRNHLKELPLEVYKLPRLRKLGLGYNQFRVIPPQIAGLTELRGLHLGGNQLGEFPMVVCQLLQLEKLFLQQNQIEVLPEEIGWLTQLRALFLNGNGLTRLPYGICNLRRLIELDLSDNLLTELPLEMMCNCSELETLHVMNNPLRALPHAIGKLTRLSDVNLKGTPLEKLPVEIADLSRLEVFVLEAPGGAIRFEEGELPDGEEMDVEELGPPRPMESLFRKLSREESSLVLGESFNVYSQ